jgi:hypothetical protein
MHHKVQVAVVVVLVQQEEMQLRHLQPEVTQVTEH